jgi:hypothetical protein
LINRTFGLSEMNAEFANDFGDKSVSLMELVR